MLDGVSEGEEVGAGVSEGEGVGVGVFVAVGVGVNDGVDEDEGDGDRPMFTVWKIYPVFLPNVSYAIALNCT